MADTISNMVTTDKYDSTHTKKKKKKWTTLRGDGYMGHINSGQLN